MNKIQWLNIEKMEFHDITSITAVSVYEQLGTCWIIYKYSPIISQKTFSTVWWFYFSLLKMNEYFLQHVFIEYVTHFTYKFKQHIIWDIEFIESKF